MAPSKQQRPCGSGTPAGDRPPPLRPEVYHLSKHGKWPMCRPARQLCPKRRLFEPRGVPPTPTEALEEVRCDGEA